MTSGGGVLWLPCGRTPNPSVGEDQLYARRVLRLARPLEAWSKAGKGSQSQEEV